MTTTREPLELFRRACRKSTMLTADEQLKIVTKLRLPAQRHVIECTCHAYQRAAACAA